MFIDTVDAEQADAAVAAIYAEAEKGWGFLPNWARVFALRPDVYAGWQHLNGALAATDRRRYELATLAAARELRSTYCALAHTRVLRDRFHPGPELVDIVTDPEASPSLDDTDRAVMAFAAKVAGDASTITAGDVAELRRHGLDDDAVLHVVMAASARAFFAKVLDGVGACADAELGALLGAELTEPLTVGRPVDDG